MSRFNENNEYAPERMVKTDFGFALKSETMPHRRDCLWLQEPSGHIYTFDGDGWMRLRPPENKIYPPEHLKHG
jgi:hypothetical protein